MYNKNVVEIKVQKLPHFYKLPQYMTEEASGADIYAATDCYLFPGRISKVPTGIAVKIPAGYELQIRSKSGLASQGIVVANSPGTIDSDYVGEISVLMMLSSGHLLDSEYRYTIKKGDRIAQMVLAPVLQIIWKEVETLAPTVRGEGGFGSTGTN